MPRTLRSTSILLLLVALIATPMLANDANVSEANVAWTAKAGHGASLTISGPGDFYHRADFAKGESPSFSAFDRQGKALADGVYSWELRFSPEQNLDSERADDPSGSNKAIGAETQSGYFSLLDGRFLSSQAEEAVKVAGDGTDAAAGEDKAVIEGQASIKAQVINTDLVVVGSTCTGLDCVNGESFGFDTLRLKENNLRIHFNDTSNSASFPSNDWRFVANDSTNGGANYMAIEDSTAGRIPFRVEAGAPVNTLYVEADGDVGVKTANPVVDIHVVEGNTPTLRLEQDGSDGFTPQTYDVAANEANFFIRDVTNGSKLFFRSKPGAPEDSLFIAADGDVGVGTDGPSERFVVQGANGTNPAACVNHVGVNQWCTRVVGADRYRISDADGDTEFDLDNAGNLVLLGTLTAGTPAMTFPDFVFEEDYELMPLDELADYVRTNKHLPEIPKAEEVGANGLNMTEMQVKLLQKVEELTLYTISQEETIRALTERLAALEGGE